jgi:hypothetical protein
MTNTTKKKKEIPFGLIAIAVMAVIMTRYFLVNLKNLTTLQALSLSFSVEKYKTN